MGYACVKGPKRNIETGVTSKSNRTRVTQSWTVSWDSTVDDNHMMRKAHGPHSDIILSQVKFSFVALSGQGDEDASMVRDSAG